MHLLLAYPLFAVVVGVDQRCLKQSLRIRFQGLLTPMEKHEVSEPSVLVDRDEPTATPLDYLEKIFHIPFHLPPMTPDGFADLVKDLTKPPLESKPWSAEPINANDDRDPWSTSGSSCTRDWRPGDHTHHAGRRGSRRVRRGRNEVFRARTPAVTCRRTAVRSDHRQRLLNAWDSPQQHDRRAQPNNPPRQALP